MLARLICFVYFNHLDDYLRQDMLYVQVPENTGQGDTF